MILAASYLVSESVSMQCVQMSVKEALSCHLQDCKSEKLLFPM